MCRHSYGDKHPIPLGSEAEFHSFLNLRVLVRHHSRCTIDGPLPVWSETSRTAGTLYQQGGAICTDTTVVEACTTVDVGTDPDGDAYDNENRCSDATRTRTETDCVRSLALCGQQFTCVSPATMGPHGSADIRHLGATLGASIGRWPKLLYKIQLVRCYVRSRLAPPSPIAAKPSFPALAGVHQGNRHSAGQLPSIERA